LELGICLEFGAWDLGFKSSYCLFLTINRKPSTVDRFQFFSRHALRVTRHEGSLCVIRKALPHLVLRVGLVGLRLRPGLLQVLLLAQLFQKGPGDVGEKLEQQLLLLVARQAHVAQPGQQRVVLALVAGGVVGGFLARAGDLQAEGGIDRDGGLAVGALDQVDELGGFRGVERLAVGLVDDAVDRLHAHDLAGGGDQGRHAGVEAHARHGAQHLVLQVLQLGLLQLGQHVGVHAARDLRHAHDVVGRREVEVPLDGLGGLQQLGDALALRRRDGAVEQGVDLRGQLVPGDVEGQRQQLVLVELRQLAADLQQLAVDGRDRLAVDAGVEAELVGEDLHQLEGRRRRAAGKIQDDGVDDVDAVDHGHQHRRQAEARGAMGVHVDGDAHVLLQGADQPPRRRRVDEPGHVLDGDHVGAQAGQLLGLGDEIADVEDLQGQRPAAQQGPDAVAHGEARVDGVADGAVGDAAVALDVADGRLHVVDVVQGVEDAHDVDARAHGIAAEALDNRVGVGVVAEQVASARQGGELGHRADGGLDLLQALPGVLVEEAHHRVGDGAAPDLHGVKPRPFITGAGGGPPGPGSCAWRTATAARRGASGRGQGSLQPFGSPWDRGAAEERRYSR